MNPLAQQLKQLAQRFDALSRRERAMVVGALLLLVLFSGHTLFVSPRLAKLRLDEAQLQQQQAELSAIRSQMLVLQQEQRDPDGPLKAELAQLRQQQGALQQRLLQVRDKLVSPEQMAGFLENILVRSKGLRLVSLRTLPVSSVIERSSEAAGKASPGIDIGNVFKHGVEISIEGTYPELLAYLAEVERAPQQVLWSKVELRADYFPRSVLTLTVYTWSLDKQWLAI
ncbi:MAG TPA: hypothetical protein VFK74_06640 [Azospira sp.]|nr:hypothetical protein [Azospira sp.]